jgi:hypothetical protein
MPRLLLLAVLSICSFLGDTLFHCEFSSSGVIRIIGIAAGKDRRTWKDYALGVSSCLRILLQQFAT